MSWKIGLASVATLALGAGLSLAAGSGGLTGQRHEQRAATTAPTTAPAMQPAKVYTCSMHPEVTSDKPGKCPKCGMNLQLKQEQKPAEGGHQHGH